MKNYDVLVIGAGPGGSSAARFAAKSGLRTLMIEKRGDIGVPVRCGEGISGELLKEASITPNPNWISAEVEGARIYGPAERKAIHLSSDNAGSEVGFVIERDKFDKELASMAVSEGADVWIRSPAVDTIMEGERVAGAMVRHNGSVEEVRAKIVIAADGFESEFGRWAGLKSVILARNDIISALEYRMAGVAIDRQFMDFYLGSSAPSGYIWVFPKGEKEANIGIGVPVSRLRSRGDLRERLDSWIQRHPALSAGRAIHIISGGISVSRLPDKIAMPGMLLVGDAARLSDPLTGGGIASACISGKMAAGTSVVASEEGDFSAGSMRRYEENVRERFGGDHHRNWLIKERIAGLSDSAIDSIVESLSDLDPGKPSAETLVNAVRARYPEAMRELDRMM